MYITKLFNHQSLFLFFFVCLLSACSDEEMPLMDEPVPVIPDTSASRATSNTQGLVLNTDGTWSATRRVPLVGMGRVVDDYTNGTVTVGTVNSKIDNLIDCDLNNYASFGAGLAKIDLATVPVVSIRDMNHTYAAGTRVGIIFKSPDNSLLTLKLLKFFSIRTKYTPINGDKTEDCEVSSGSSGSGLLGLSLINVGGDNGLKEISFTTSKRFNEVQFWVNGIDVNALAGAGLEIYYAFVGENEIQHAVRGSKFFPDAKVDNRGDWTRMPGKENLVDADLTNCAAFELVTGLFGQPCATVDFGRDVPAGWEVGFEIANSELLTLGTGTELETYDANDKKVDQVTEAKVLGLNLQAGAHRRLSLIATKPLRKVRIFFPTLIKLGVTQIYYAYARPKVELDASNIFSLPNEINIKNDFLILPNPEGGKTTWNVISGPVNATISTDNNTGITKLRGMKEDGDYQLMGTFIPNATNTTQEQPQPINVITTVRRKANTTINYELITNKTHGAINDKVVPSIVTGGLIPLEFITNQDNIIDNDPYSYASFGGLSLAANHAIANISWPAKNSVNQGCKSVRAGFILQTSFNFLNVDLLNTYRVLLFNNGEIVADSKGTQGGGLKGLQIGLINVRGDQSKMFVQTDAPFNQMVLMNSGVLDLSASKTRIYGAFWESTDKNVVGIDEAGVEYLDYIQHGAQIEYEHTFIGKGLASIGGTFTDLGKNIDHNGDSYSVNGGLNVATGTSTAIKFNPITSKTPQRIGLVVRNTGGLSLNVIKSYTISLYNNGEPLKDQNGKNIEKSVGGGLLDVDLTAKPARVFTDLLLPGGQTVDEIRMTGGEAVNLNNGLKIQGAYVKLDNDGDGIPDGTEDNEIPETDPNSERPLVIKLESDPDVCAPGNVKLYVQKYVKTDGTFVLSTAPPDNYVVKYVNLAAADGGITQKPVELDNGRCTLTDLPEGIYQFAVKIANNDKTYSNAVEVYIHPTYTEWRTNPIDTDWNNWNNWTNGSPWHCTNVVIPDGCTKYPALKDAAAQRSGNKGYYANNVHFGPGAELIYSHRLEYKKTWVEMYVPAGYHFLLSAPLKEMVTGDLFIPANMQGDHRKAKKFEDLVLANCKDERFSPRIYQYFWNQTVNGKIIADEQLTNQSVTCDETDWSKSFNAVAESYQPGVGFKMMATKGALSSGDLFFRFPKTHDYYSYFDGMGNNTGQAEVVNRNSGYIGRFIYEGATTTSGPWEYKVTLKNTLKANLIFAAGNPLMAHLDIAKFLKANPNIVDVKLYDGNGFSTMSRNSRTPGNTGIIAPMQGFMVSVANPSTSLEVTFNEDMQVQASDIGTTSILQRNGRNRTRTSKSSAVTNDNDLTITASCGGMTTTCMVRMNSKAENGYRCGEDSKLLYDRESPSTATVFTIADGLALEFQQCADRRRIPLGLRMAEPSDVSLLITFKPGGRWNGWALEDHVTGKVYPFGTGSAYITLNGAHTETDRYYLITKQ